jgi:hypothetical protein
MDCTTEKVHHMYCKYPCPSPNVPLANRLSEKGSRFARLGYRGNINHLYKTAATEWLRGIFCCDKSPAPG